MWKINRSYLPLSKRGTTVVYRRCIAQGRVILNCMRFVKYEIRLHRIEFLKQQLLNRFCSHDFYAFLRFTLCNYSSRLLFNFIDFNGSEVIYILYFLTYESRIYHLFINDQTVIRKAVIDNIVLI